MVQFQSGLCNGPGTVQMDLPLFQFGGQICIFGFELIFALLERKDDLDQFGAAHMPQFTVCHNGAPPYQKRCRAGTGPAARKSDFRTEIRQNSEHLYIQHSTRRNATKP